MTPETMGAGTDLASLIAARRSSIGPVLPLDLSPENVVVLDLSPDNRALDTVDLADTEAFSAYVEARLAEHGAAVGIGRYAEPRVIYQHSALFDGEAEARTVHLGIDLFAPAGTPVLAPLEGRIHSFAVNPGVGNYGPTIILEHELEGRRLFTLYGHLAAASLAGLATGREVARGAELAQLGAADENGSWPPHLHLQIIGDMEGRVGDFPGVAARSELERYLKLCPSPGLLLGPDLAADAFDYAG